MWVVLMILLNTVPGLERTYVLNTFDTQEECQSERNRIGFDMAASHPYERDFIIVCQLNPRKES
jgi:hypothetical protein